MTVVSDKFQPVQDDIDLLETAVDSTVPYTPGSQSALVQDTVTALGTQNNRMHSVGGLIDRVDDLELTPPSDIVLNANFAAGGNATIVGNQLQVGGVNHWKILDNDPYGAGNDGLRIQSWSKGANVSLVAGGLNLHAMLEGRVFNVAGSRNYPAAAAFLSSRDATASAAEKYPIPLFHEITVVFTDDGYVEDFNSIWLRHVNGGASHGEFDLYESVAAELDGNHFAQYGLPNIGYALTPKPWKARFVVTAGTEITIVHRLERISTNVARVTVTMNGNQPYQTAATSGVTSSTIKVFDFDPTTIVGLTPDPNHAFDIAFQKHQGYLYSADVLETYQSPWLLRNNTDTGKALSTSTNTYTWTSNTPAQTSDLTIKSLVVKSLIDPPPVPPDDCVSILHEPFNNLTTNSWSNVGGTVVTGRNGTAASITGSGGALGYSIATAKQSNYMTMGFAYRVSNVGASARSIFSLRDSANADFMTLRVNTDGSLSLIAGSAGTAYGTSAAGLLATNTWAYLELQVLLDNTAGYYTVKVNGTSVLSGTGIDTQSLATPASAIAILLLRTPGTVQNAQFDDLYISAGTSCTFQGDHVE